jgi:proline iminopeptidase
MQTEIKEILISSREYAPETTLRVRLVYKNQKALENLPYVFMLLGGPGATHSYYTDYDCLHQVCNLIYFDPRGCGLSDKSDPATYTMNNYIDDVNFIKKVLELDSIILLGKSYGAMCALGYTLRYPKDVNKLILAAGVPTYTFIETAKMNILARGTAEQQGICNTLWAGEFTTNEHVALYFKIMASMYSWKTRNNQSVNRPTPSLPFAFEPLNEGFKHQFWEFDYTKELKNITCPTLILVGGEDWVTDPMYSKKMAALIPLSKLHVFERADHAMETDVPDLFFNSIINFIEEE